jgi:hypothetical protein
LRVAVSFRRNTMPTHPSRWTAALVGLLLLPLLACAKSDHAANASDEPPSTPAAAAGAATPAPNPLAVPAKGTGVDVARRVIRTADLSIEADSPEVIQQRIAQLADAKGGFVVSADTSRWRGDDGAETTTVNVVFRVPSATFDATLDELRRMGRHVSNEKVTGQDVTEEYVDLEARIRAQRAVEDSYLSILKDAKTIHDALEVQQKLGEVRTEIERVEGRRRFLENQTSLSTITAHIARRIEAVEANGPGFGHSVRKAGRDAVDVSIAIVNGVIRTVGVLLPVFVLLGLPFYLFIRFLVRRRRRTHAAA